MSHTEVETSVKGMNYLYHQYVKLSDILDKASLLKMLKENFPYFFKACDKKGKDYLSCIFEEKDNKNQKIPFSEFLSFMDYYNQSHSLEGCSRGNQ